jgi:hypothetical protein
MQRFISRRAVLRSGLIAGALSPLVGFVRPVIAADLSPLDPSDTTAKSLGFVTDATKVDASANPTYKSTQKCATCAQFQGKTGDATAGCAIFPAHSVPATGWCKVWAQRPGT